MKYNFKHFNKNLIRVFHEKNISGLDIYLCVDG